MPNPPMPGLTTGRLAFTYCPIGTTWFRMEPSPQLVPEARRFTRAMLTGCDADYVDDAEVVVSELVTNAVNCAANHGDPAQHVAPGIWLGVQGLKRFCHLYVRDPHPMPPVKRTATETDTSGRGLFIVEALTVAFWTSPRAYDKTVHAVIAKPGVVLTEAELDKLRR